MNSVRSWVLYSTHRPVAQIGQAGEARIGFAPIAAATRPQGGGALQLKPQAQ
jgi:hypothetical protein